ncbi:hypothetical protein O59_003383 [Cellvibrio sp. BR]|nr:hypothetical protein O59_003383 [Cellvibrio sp. BR]QEY12288.1 hypothetical protein D0B88_08500 [Cellvibrio sp. KY-YJ-3]
MCWNGCSVKSAVVDSNTEIICASAGDGALLAFLSYGKTPDSLIDQPARGGSLQKNVSAQYM